MKNPTKEEAAGALDVDPHGLKYKTFKKLGPLVKFMEKNLLKGLKLLKVMQERSRRRGGEMRGGG